MSTSEFAIACGFTLYLILALSFSYLKTAKIKRWPYVIGRLSIAEVEYLHMVERGSAWTNVSYQYEVDGKEYVGTRLSPLQVLGQVGPKIRKQLSKIEYVSARHVKVYYDVNDPSQSYLVRESWIDIFSG